MKLSAKINKELNQNFTEEDALNIELRRMICGNKKQRRAQSIAKQARKVVTE